MSDTARLDDAQRRFFAELTARGIPWFVGGTAALALQGIGAMPSQIDLHVADRDARVLEAAKIAGCDVGPRWPPPARRVVLQASSHRPSFDRDLAHAIDVTIDGALVRVLSVARVVSNRRRERRPGPDPVEEELRAHGIEIPIAAKVAGIELGWIYGMRKLVAVADVLDRAGYELSCDGRAGSYETEHDTDPRTGSTSAFYVLHEDPERPVLAEIDAALREPE